MKPSAINTEVSEQGWALFDIDSTGHHQIQRIDEDDLFEDDAAALAHVIDSAERGGVFEAAALAHHYASIAGLDVVCAAGLAQNIGAPADL
jgi:hypothetical protein